MQVTRDQKRTWAMILGALGGQEGDKVAGTGLESYNCRHLLCTRVLQVGCPTSQGSITWEVAANAGSPAPPRVAQDSGGETPLLCNTYFKRLGRGSVG